MHCSNTGKPACGIWSGKWVMKPHWQESSLEALPTVEEVIAAFNLVSTSGCDPDHRDESDQRLLLALLFVLRKRLENRRLPIMHTRDWKTNLKGQDLFSKFKKRKKKKKHTPKLKKNQQNIKKKKSLKQLFLDWFQLAGPKLFQRSN